MKISYRISADVKNFEKLLRTKTLKDSECQNALAPEVFAENMF